jgi:Mn2+/Fe2+ NRAMP family transporter
MSVATAAPKRPPRSARSLFRRLWNSLGRQGIDADIRHAPAFYRGVGLAMSRSVALDFARINPSRALYWTAVLNGLLAPFLLTGILIVASDRKLMGGQPSSRLGRITVGLTTLAMVAAAIGMFVF